MNITNTVFITAIISLSFFLGYLYSELTQAHYVFLREYVLYTPPPIETVIYPTKDEDQVTVNWIKDEFTVDLTFKEYEEKTGVAISGLSYSMDGYCNVYAHDFETLEERKAKTFLHEVVHCFKGSWHR